MKAWLKKNHPDAIRIWRLIRYEVVCVIAHTTGKVARKQRDLLKNVKPGDRLKLNIASGGSTHAGWLNIDVTSAADVQIDLRRRFPLPDGSAALIFCEHFCDHLNFPDVIAAFLSECHRVLEDNGRARFVLHDTEGLARAYLARDKKYFEVSEIVLGTAVESVNLLFRFNDGHQFLYDQETFEKLLREAGFSRVVRSSYCRSECPELVLDMVHPSREMMSMYIEAIK
jgi:predicted SAM-dependent methyltransferase